MQNDVHQSGPALLHREALLEGVVAVRRDLEDVGSRHEDPPIFPKRSRLGSKVAILDLDARLRDGVTRWVPHDPFHSPMGLSDVSDQSRPVVLPEFRQGVARRELAAAHLQRQFHDAVPDVVVVLHPAGQIVPSRSIGRPVGKLLIAGIARAGGAHFAVVESVGRCQMFKSVVVRSQRGLISPEVGQDPGTALVVEGVGGHQGASMECGGKDELGLMEPSGNGRGFRLHLAEALHSPSEEVREVPVEILTVRVVPPLDALTVSFTAGLESVRVHGGHDVDPRRIHQLADVAVPAVVGQQVLRCQTKVYRDTSNEKEL